MNVTPISDDSKTAISNLCNKTIQVEYEFFLGYPRIVDHLTNFMKISDKQLINDLDVLGKDSLRHFEKMGNIITRTGHEVSWKTPTLPRLMDVTDILERQLEKEVFARDCYREVKNVVMNNRGAARTGNVFTRFMRVRASASDDVMTADEIIDAADRLITDEEKHARVVQDSIATLRMLIAKQSQ